MSDYDPHRKYVYSFTVWPAKRRQYKALITLFGLLNQRVEMVLTEPQFVGFRTALESDFALQDVNRATFHEPEAVP